MNGIVISGIALLAGLASPSFAAEKDWTLLVFLNGHNDLDSFGAQDIVEMQAGKAKNVNVVVQWASADHGQTRRVLVDKGRVNVVETLAPVDMGDYRELIEFVRWGVKTFPAKNYFVDVWNHGKGWLPPAALAASGGLIRINNISYDELSGNSISIPELGLAMAEAQKIVGRKIDIYGSDACLMQMVEVAHEVSDNVRYVIGSEDLEPGAGWNYDALLATDWGTPEAVGKRVVDTFMTTDTDIQLSVVDASKLDALVTSMKGLAEHIALNPGPAVTAAGSALEYDNMGYIDIASFLDNYAGGTAEDEVTAALNDAVIHNSANGRIAKSKGLSVWMPAFSSTTRLPDYRQMKFAKATGWGEMLDTLWGH